MLAQERINLAVHGNLHLPLTRMRRTVWKGFIRLILLKANLSQLLFHPIGPCWDMKNRFIEDSRIIKPSEGFYVREFTIPQDWKDKRILLHFGGVWSSAEVWLNGERTGRHDCGYTSFAFDVTNKLKVDEPNKLAVRVRQITREYKFDVCDDRTWGGIYRDVTLEAMPAKRWIDDVVVQTTFDHLSVVMRIPTYG